MFRQFIGLPRQVYLLAVVRCVMAMGTFVFAFISLLASTRLGMDEFQIGHVMFFVALANVGGSLAGGKLADLAGRRPVFLAADGLAVAFIWAAGALCDTPWVLVFVILSYAFSSMSLPVIAAMITDTSGLENRTECFSVLYLSQNLGYAIGPSIGGLLFNNYMQWAFYGQGILYALSGLCMIFLVKDRYVPAPRAPREPRAEPRQEGLLAALVHRPVVLAFVFCLILLTICYQEISFILPLQFTDMFGVADGSRYAGFMWTVNAVVCLLFTPALINLFKRRNQLLNIAFAALLYAVGFALNGLVDQIWMFYAAVAVWTSGEILVSTGAGVFIANRAPETHRARFQSLYEMARGFGRGIGPNIFGYYLLTHTYRQTWLGISAICIAAILFLAALYRAEKRSRLAGV